MFLQGRERAAGIWQSVHWRDRLLQCTGQRPWGELGFFHRAVEGRAEDV